MCCRAASAAAAAVEINFMLISLRELVNTEKAECAASKQLQQQIEAAADQDESRLITRIVVKRAL